MTTPEPLTAARQPRTKAALDLLYDMGLSRKSERRDRFIERLLRIEDEACLDAERAKGGPVHEQTVKTFYERSQEGTATPASGEAALAVPLTKLDDLLSMYGSDPVLLREQIHRAAIRAEAGTLDMERLARADHVKSGGRCQDFGANDHEWQDHMAAARAIAAEYARLAGADR